MIQAQYEFQFTDAERRAFRMKEKISTSGWAEKYRYVTNGPRPGRWSNKVTPYCTLPMDMWDDPYVRRIILRWPPQSGKTQVAFNCLCKAIDTDPGPAMYVMPDEKVAKRISRRRIIPMFRETPKIAELLSPRPDDVSMLSVSFINGMDLMMAWATSAAELSSESVRYLFADEVDKFPPFSGKEADPLSLAEQRTNAYLFTKKILITSSPTDELGPITVLMETEADVIFEYYARCTICGEYQIMAFENIIWPHNVRDPREVLRKKLAHYMCISCGMKWNDYRRDEAVRNGEWRPNKQIIHPVSVAFQLRSWYTPFVSLSESAAAFLRGQDDLTKLMVFVTQHQTEAWKETVEPKKESEVLTNKTDLPALIVPPEALALTCGIDVQKNGFWFAVRAWDIDLTSWLIQYGYLTAWADIDALVFETRYQVHGSEQTMRIWRAGIDTGGGPNDDGEWSRTEEVYEWLRKNGRGIVFGTKGSSHTQLNKIKVSVIEKMPRTNTPIRGGLELRMLDTEQFKELIHYRISRKKGETQQFHLHAETGIDYARQLLAEEKRRDPKTKKIRWKKIRRDNHLLDCEVIAAACADPEWLPSLKMLATFMKEKKAQPAQSHDAARIIIPEQHQIRRFQRPNWLNKRQ